MSPNDQNSDRGIETRFSNSRSIVCAKVRTTRIPTEELKRFDAVGGGATIFGPNDQNSDRGIETSSAHADGRHHRQVRTTRIPTEELKPRSDPIISDFVLVVRTTRIPTEELKHEMPMLAGTRRASPNDQNSDRGIETGSLGDELRLQ